MLTLRIDGSHASVSTPGGEIARYSPGSGEKGRPHLHPIQLPGGVTLTADRPGDHLHHHGLWIAHHRVQTGGRTDDFYLEGGQQGNIVHTGFENVTESGPAVGFSARHRWVAPDGYCPLQDRWDLGFGLYEGGDVWIDFHLHLWATAGTVTLGSTNECALPLVRMAESVCGKNGGLIRNSRGHEKEWMTFGRRAEWCDYTGPGPDAAGIAIFDHPGNPSFPSPWFTRDYGPFGPHANFFDGDLTISPQRPLSLRYRLVVHQGDSVKARLSERWRDYYLSAAGGTPPWQR